jgi:tetratricopeptide (TPR) repeat protein
VYGLGAILYETLTGRPPFRGPTALETLAQVREREPVPPRQLQPGVPRDLQTICLKCLHKEPRRRYRSALEMAEDLRRFAAAEPIRARPVGRWERLLKWMRRNPYRAVLAVFSILVSLTAVAALLWHDQRLQKEKDRAHSAEQNAQNSYAKARQTLLSILDRYDHWYLSKDKIIGRMSEGMIQDTLTYIESVLAKGSESDPQVREDAARLLSRIGRIQGYHGKFDEARVSFGRALTLWEQLSREQPQVSSYRLELAHCYRSLVYLGGVAEGQRIEWLEKAVQIFEELCSRDPKDDLHHPAGLAQCHNDLACLFMNRLRFAEAEAHLQKAIALFQSEIDPYPDRSRCKHGLADCHINLALIYGARRAEQAESAYRRADSLLERLMSEVPDDLGVFTSRSAMTLNWGNLYLGMGQTDKALASYERGISWCEAVLEKDAHFSSARVQAWKLHGAKAQAYDSLKRYAEAAAEWKRALEWAEGPMCLQMRICRSLSLARGGDTAQAAAEADNVVANPACSLDTLYNCACVLALCDRGEQAIALLSKLRSNGYFKEAGHLKQLHADSDFDSLRPRDDFVEFVNDLTKPD